MKRIVGYIRDFLAPPCCAYCSTFLHSSHEILCSLCNQSIQSITTSPFKITEKTQGKVFAISDYKDPLRSLVLAKHNRNRIASQQLGKLLWKQTDLKFAEFDYIVPLPLHWTRYAWRWFNQAEVMADEIAILSGKPVLHLIERSRRTVSQTGLSRKERKNNMQNAFVLKEKGNHLKGKTFLFIDDVMTTGTTLHAAIEVVRPLKIKNFLVGVACRVL